MWHAAEDYGTFCCCPCQTVHKAALTGTKHTASGLWTSAAVEDLWAGVPQPAELWTLKLQWGTLGRVLQQACPRCGLKLQDRPWGRMLQPTVLDASCSQKARDRVLRLDEWVTSAVT